MTKTQTREQWLSAATIELRKHIKATSGVVVPAVNVSVGFPGGRGDKSGVIGQCWNKSVVANKRAAIFISPVLTDKVRILDVLLHEMVHAAHPEAGHKGDFAQTAKAAGLTGHMTATVASPELKATLTKMAKRLGRWTDGSIKTTGTIIITDPKTGLPRKATPWGAPKQSTRMLKVQCPEDGYTVRTTAKWLAVGLPVCPCGTEMVQNG